MILLADSEGPDQCTDAQTDLSFHYQHLPEDTFWNGMAHMFSYVSTWTYAVIYIYIRITSVRQYCWVSNLYVYVLTEQLDQTVFASHLTKAL